MSTQHVKVAVTGAAGQIGYALLFRIASGAMFGPEITVDLSLIELERSLTALSGVVMELQDGAFPLLREVTYTSDLKKGFEGANWAILVGSAPRKAGMDRSDLLTVNGHIFADQGSVINRQAAQDIRVLVVGNPCNTNCLIAMNSAPDIPKDRFYAMTLLDENRARSALAEHAKVPVTDVTQMNIWGNHSSTQYPDVYRAKIRGESAVTFIGDEFWLQTTFIANVQNRGGAIIKARGASSAASAANAAIRTVYHLTHDTPQGESFSVCLASKGAYGVDEGLVFSYPCRVVAGQLEVVSGIQHNDFAQAMIRKTMDELRQESELAQQLLSDRVSQSQS